MFSSKKKNSPEKNAEKPVENLKVIYNAVVAGDYAFLSELTFLQIKELRLTNYERSMLHLGVWHNHRRLVSKICKSKVLRDLVNQQDANGDTPLHFAVYVKSYESYKTLINAEADVQALNKKNEKPLDLLDDSEESATFVQHVFDDLPDTIPKDRVHAMKKRFGKKLRIATNPSDSVQGEKTNDNEQDKQANKAGGYTVFLEGQTFVNYQPKNAADDNNNNNFDERLSAKIFLNAVSPNTSQDASQFDVQTTFSNRDFNKQREDHIFSTPKLIIKEHDYEQDEIDETPTKIRSYSSIVRPELFAVIKRPRFQSPDKTFKALRTLKLC